MEIGIRTVDKNNPWRFDPQQIAGLIAEQWPGTTFRPASKATAFRFYGVSSKAQTKGLDGFLTSNRKEVAIEGYESDCINFILWLRPLVPPAVKLGLTDNYHGTFLELTVNTSEQDILDFWHSKP